MDRAPIPTNPVEKARIEAGVSLLGLSNLTGISRTTLRRKLENPHQFSLGETNAIGRALNTDDLGAKLLKFLQSEDAA